MDDTAKATSASVTQCKIERIVKFQAWRGTNTARFQTPEGYFLCDVWFELGKPQFQIRSNVIEVGSMVNTIETASIIAAAIQMAISWAIEEMERGENDVFSSGNH